MGAAFPIDNCGSQFSFNEFIKQQGRGEGEASNWGLYFLVP